MPGLAKKPQGDGGKKSAGEEKNGDERPADPFAPPYVEELFVAEETVKEDEDDSGEAFVVLVRMRMSPFPRRTNLPRLISPSS